MIPSSTLVIWPLSLGINRFCILDVQVAKKLLPEGSLIGVTVASLEEARIAVQNGADYLGIGTVFATPT